MPSSFGWLYICFHLMSSWQWLVQACGSPGLTYQSQDCQENVAWVPEVSVVGGLGLCHIPEKW